MSKATRTTNGTTDLTLRRAPDRLEVRALEGAVAKLEQARGRYQVSYDGKQLSVSAPHSDTLGHGLMMFQAFGTTSSAFARNSFADIASVVRGHKAGPTEDEVNAALALVDGGEPQNEVEAALLVQMASTHSAAMQCLRTATGDLRLATEGGVGNLAVKLLRTYTSQVDALTKLRRGGEQVVRHIHVDNRGGQAIIAETVVNGEKGNAELGDQVHGTPEGMRRANPGRPPLRHAGDEERTLPASRRKVDGRAKRQHERAEARPLHGEGDR